MGLNSDGIFGFGYELGMELCGKYVLISEGVCGSLVKELIVKYDLFVGYELQKFGFGMKEIWEIDFVKVKFGIVMYMMGWFLGKNVGGGSFIYYLGGNQVLVGFVVYLNYKNFYLYFYMEFQCFKYYLVVVELLEGGKCVVYGVWVISEGGFQLIFKMVVLGVVLLGCSVGLVNVFCIKGNYNVMLLGIVVVDVVVVVIVVGCEGDEFFDYEIEVCIGVIGKDLCLVCNVKLLWLCFGLWLLLVLGGFDMWVVNLIGWNLLGMWKYGKIDVQVIGKVVDYMFIDYFKFDGKLFFD